MSEREGPRALTSVEYEAATKAFVERLGNAISNAGCNDVGEDEFGESLAEKYHYDGDILDDWRVLVTAAPDLLAACRMVMRASIACPEDLASEVEACRAAIEKAAPRG